MSILRTLAVKWELGLVIHTYVPPQDPGRLQLMKYSEKLQRSTAKIGAKFIDYVSESGSWVFEVEHFSKYRLLDDDSDDEEEQGGQTKTGAAPKVRSTYVHPFVWSSYTGVSSSITYGTHILYLCDSIRMYVHNINVLLYAVL